MWLGCQLKHSSSRTPNDEYSVYERQSGGQCEPTASANNAAGAAEPDGDADAGFDQSRVHLDGSRGPFGVLGLEEGAPLDAIKRAYRRLSLKYHPDKNVGDANAQAAKHFATIAEAHDILTDPQRRRHFSLLM